MSSHAILSASSSKRWLNCPPSAKLCAEVEDTTSEYAKEGTDAHTLCEYKVKSMLGIKMQDPTDSLSYYNEEMEFVVEPGQLDIMVGTSSEDLPFKETISLTGEKICVAGKRSYTCEVEEK